MKTRNINLVINANAKTGKILNNAAKAAFPRYYNRALAATLKKDERKSLSGDALERHNSLTDADLVQKAMVMTLNALKKGKLSNKITRPEIERAINSLTMSELHRLEDRAGFNLQKLLDKINVVIIATRKKAAKGKK